MSETDVRQPWFDPLGKFARLRLIRDLDPERDHTLIYRISAGLEFPWDYRRALELALFRTFCVPSISGLLRRTGEFARRTQKRYDDTSILMEELGRHGYDSRQGKRSLRMINRMHGRYDISNDDMLYVLSTFVYDPIRWIDAYGWRSLSEHERLAAYHYYRQVGRRMGIHSIPDYVEFERFNREYEAEHFVFAESNRAVGLDSLAMVCAWFPRPMRWLVARGFIAGLEPAMRTAFGFPEPREWEERAVAGALRWHGRLERLLPSRRVSRLGRGRKLSYPGYPHGYDLDDLGALDRCPVEASG
ncbi:oxygenase MpaB family protein [Actinopolyspora mortivallis]|uniref:oxygenase MpaB family protein n=1 Tax=Actinopolyspora mortivallis TaxID=33906 RepID=UPI000372BD89|nr:oxygenase MpaB family protein [Actinopolyspora mortivallis]